MAAYITSQVLFNGQGVHLIDAEIYYSFFLGGRIGSLTGITPLEGTTFSSSSGTVTLYNLPTGAGLLMLARRATSGISNATTDMVYIEAVTTVDY